MKPTTLKWGLLILTTGTAIALRKQIAYRLRIAKTMGGIISAHVESRLTGRPVGVLLARQSPAVIDEPWVHYLQQESGDEFTPTST